MLGRSAAWVAFAIFLAGCTAPINQRNAARHHDSGMRAAVSGDLTTAEQSFSRALVDARLGGSPKSTISMAAYNLGRTKALLCKLDEAESLLGDALDAEEESSGKSSGLTSMRLLELARVKYAKAENVSAGRLYARAISNIRALGIGTSDPLGFALVLDDYGVVLAKAGNMADAETIRAEAIQLREENQSRKPAFIPDNFRQKCSRSGT